jgi:FkbM family methyltransferase
MARGLISDLIRKFSGPAAEVSPAADAPKPAERVKLDRKHVLPGWAPEYLAKLQGVRTVIDIGVLAGTPRLYAAFPDAYLILIEALPAFEAQVRQILDARPGEVHMCAAGSTDGTAVIRHVEAHPAVSSLLPHLRGTRRSDVTEIEVPVRRLDTLFAGRRFNGDVLLKIDTEGMELDIIRGAGETLRQVRYCIAETSIAARHAGSYRMAELFAEMAVHGFDVFDIMTVTRSKLRTPGANIADVLFISRNA